MILVLAAVLTGSLFILTPEKKLPLLSTLGTRTMSVYMLHPFILLYMDQHKEQLPQQFWFPLLVTVACVVIFAQKPFVWLTSPLTELQKLRQEKGKKRKKAAQHAGK